MFMHYHIAELTDPFLGLTQLFLLGDKLLPAQEDSSHCPLILRRTQLGTLNKQLYVAMYNLSPNPLFRLLWLLRGQRFGWQCFCDLV